MTDAARVLREAMARCSLVAILRGIAPGEVTSIGTALVEAGMSILEIPLNSPDALESIRTLSRVLEGRALVGAGTVLTTEQVDDVRNAGGALIVSPDCNPRVIEATIASGLVSMPGYFTVTEAFSAISAGATALKLFPADGLAPDVLRAQRAVLPRTVPVLPVGGITPESMAAWISAGADGFGIGSNLYRPGKPVADIVGDAEHFIRELRDCT